MTPLPVSEKQFYKDTEQDNIGGVTSSNKNVWFPSSEGAC